MTYQTLACVADQSPKAQESCVALNKKYNLTDDIETADAVIALGGDGFMMRTMHRMMDTDIPIYGMNCGTVGFLMNSYQENNLHETLHAAKLTELRPLKMVARTVDGETHEALAINEVSLLRESRQASKIKVSVDGHTRLSELVCDGIMVSTPAGSTAYNLSVNGPIIPIGSEILALTPISPFRPRRWHGALLKHKTVVSFDVLDSQKRPVSAVADFTEVRDVISVEVRESTSSSVKLLFDQGHSLEERIIREQFSY